MKVSGQEDVFVPDEGMELKRQIGKDTGIRTQEEGETGKTEEHWNAPSLEYGVSCGSRKNETVSKTVWCLPFYEWNAYFA